MDQAASELTRIIRKAIESSTPKVTINKKAKPWWTPELKSLRKELGQAKQLVDTDLDNNTSKEVFKRVRNNYFQAIKTAKKDHWNHFLEKEDT